MVLPRLPACDVALKALQLEDGTFRITVGLANPPAGLPHKLVAAPYNYPRLTELAATVFDRLDLLVATTPMTRDDLNDADLRRDLDQLDNLLYGLRFPRYNLSLRDILERAISGGAVSMSVNAEIGMLPWEITSLAEGRMLGSLLEIYGTLDEAPDESGDDDGGELRIGTASGSGRAPRTFDGTLTIRGAGDRQLSGAAREAYYISSPGGISSGTIAPTVAAVADEPLFFSHFGPAGYEIVHLFSHCDYDANGFRIGISDAYTLGVIEFNTHAAQFPSNAFHFLNVCNGAPSPATRDSSLVEYLANQHAAGGLVASLVTIRSLTAVRMAEQFYESFLPKNEFVAGNRAGRALFEAREILWQQDCAAGYLYRVYGRPDAALVPLALRLSMLEAAGE